jgi:ribosomal protein S15P/S13E
MFRRAIPLLQMPAMPTVADEGNPRKMKKQKGFFLGGDFTTQKVVMVRYREARKVDGEQVQMRGEQVHRSATNLKKQMEKQENPMIWIWYPWRRNPERPIPSFPCPNALKNLNGAFIGELTGEQSAARDRALGGASRREYRAPDLDEKMAAKHPFLRTILTETKGKRKGFPFFFKKYPTRHFATEARFNIPEEMLEGTSPELQRALSPQNMSSVELVRREKSIYRERFLAHEMDESSPALVVVNLAIEARELRNHCLSNPHNNIWKSKLYKTERNLRSQLTRLRKANFRQYWEIVRDHDLMDIVQPLSVANLRKGRYFERDWDVGLGISTNIAQFMDPRGVAGCIETGRSRAEVARDLGLSYTRALLPHEKKTLTANALHFERLQRFRNEMPDAFIERQRKNFMHNFTGIYKRTVGSAPHHDFPHAHRRLLHTKMLRWKSARHGPN